MANSDFYVLYFCCNIFYIMNTNLYISSIFYYNTVTISTVLQK